MRNSQPLIKPFAMAVMALWVMAIWVSVVPSSRAATATDDGQSQTVGGLAFYFGVVPAEIVKGPAPRSAERPMHGGVPKGPHEYHVVVAIFDATTGVRIADATITAQVSGLGLAGTKKKLDPMEIANTITYGAFINLPGPDLYTVRLTVERPARAPTYLEFKYDHRRK